MIAAKPFGTSRNVGMQCVFVSDYNLGREEFFEDAGPVIYGSVDMFPEQRGIEVVSRQDFDTAAYANRLATAEKLWADMRFRFKPSLLGFRRFVGRYISGTCVTKSVDRPAKYPYNLIPHNRLVKVATTRTSWPDGRLRVELTDPVSFENFSRVLAAECRTGVQSKGVDGAYYDNYSHPESDGSVWPFSVTLEAMSYQRRCLNERGKVTMANIGVIPEKLTDADLAGLIRSTDGVSFEMPWYDGTKYSARKDRAATTRLMYAYRHMLDGGLGVVLIPNFSFTTWEERNRDTLAILAMALLVYEEGDQLFVGFPAAGTITGGVQHKPTWPLVLNMIGVPMGKAVGNTIDGWTREWSGALMTVGPGGTSLTFHSKS